MRDIKLSVLITTYNLEKYVAETLDSVLNQKTDYIYEVLVGDDGSSDKTVEIVKKYQKSYPDIIRYYVMDREQDKKYDRIERASRNRINLINHAKGEYLIFLDGDDFYVDERKLDKQIKLLESDEYKNCIACGHNVWTYYDEDNKIPINQKKDMAVIKAKDYWKYGMYLHSDSIMFRNIYNGYFPDSIPGAHYDDNIITFCLLTKGDILYIPDTMVCYRQLENSSWNTMSDMDRNIVNLMDIDLELTIDKNFKKESLKRHLYPILYVWLHNEEVTKEIYDKYYPQIEECRMSWTKHWLNYKKHSKVKRFRMTAWLMANLVEYVFIKVGRVVLKKYL